MPTHMSFQKMVLSGGSGRDRQVSTSKIDL